MKKKSILILACICLATAQPAFAQTVPSGKTLAASMDVHVFPKNGQASEQQSKDEASCYEWAEGNSGSDPFALQQQQKAQAQQTEQAKTGTNQSVRGSGLRGALGGAAAGAIIGELASNNAGKGAAIGAASGGLLNRRRSQRNANQAANQIGQQGQEQQQATKEKIISFKKAFSVCLEAKEYLVKF